GANFFTKQTCKKKYLENLNKNPTAPPPKGTHPQNNAKIKKTRKKNLLAKGEHSQKLYSK
ncbi:hypothetical protein ODY75_20345, partial [Shewanella xiamenensis]|uniref:hypothetical protein n=1 Tax=Shewanella xiamenensis TaxID=332186 RepID=UPI0024A66638